MRRVVLLAIAPGLRALVREPHLAQPGRRGDEGEHADRRVDRACARERCSRHRPQVVEGVRAPRSPAARRARRTRRWRRARRARRGPSAGTRRDRRARACARSRRSTGRCPERSSSVAATSSRSAVRVERQLAARRAAGELDDRAPAAARHRQRRRDRRPRAASGVGKTWVSGPPSIVSGAPAAATIRPATVRAPATEICWPTTARTAVSNGSTLPGTRSPGRRSHHRAEHVVAGERLVDGVRIGVEVEQPADPAHRGVAVARVGEAQPHVDARRASG